MNKKKKKNIPDKVFTGVLGRPSRCGGSGGGGGSVPSGPNFRRVHYILASSSIIYSFLGPRLNRSLSLTLFDPDPKSREFLVYFFSSPDVFFSSVSLAILLTSFVLYIMPVFNITIMYIHNIAFYLLLFPVRIQYNHRSDRRRRRRRRPYGGENKIHIHTDGRARYNNIIIVILLVPTETPVYMEYGWSADGQQRPVLRSNRVYGIAYNHARYRVQCYPGRVVVRTFFGLNYGGNVMIFRDNVTVGYAGFNQSRAN